jgi:hypothetical protein
MMMNSVTGLAESNEILRAVVCRVLVDVMNHQVHLLYGLPSPLLGTDHQPETASHAYIGVPLQDNWPHLPEPIAVTVGPGKMRVARTNHALRVS